MVVSFAHPCPICGHGTYGEVHEECARRRLTMLPDPQSMTAAERYAEMLAYQQYPAGWPLDLLKERVEALIGREFRRGEPVPTDWDDSEAVGKWFLSMEHTPPWTDRHGWEQLAAEARDSEFPDLLATGGE